MEDGKVQLINYQGEQSFQAQLSPVQNQADQPVDDIAGDFELGAADQVPGQNAQTGTDLEEQTVKVTAEEILQIEAQQEKEAQLDLGGDGEDQDAD